MNSHDDLDKQIENKKKEILLAKIAIKKQEIANKENLPHLHAFKHYTWSRRFFESRNRENFLVASNQSGKSSVSIRKAIHWATHKPLWPKLWPHLTPNQFWFLTSTKDVATAEWHTKWKQFMPRDRKCPIYGWEVEMERKLIKAVHFNSGVTIYFKTYSQDVEDLQSGTCFSVFCFVAGTEVITPYGKRPIESIRPGDFVMGQYGFNEVRHNMARASLTIEAHFSNGVVLRGSPEHPIFTQRGFIPMGELTLDDVCTNTGPCDYTIKTLLFLIRKFILDTLKILTSAKETIGALLRVELPPFMSRCGRLLIKRKYDWDGLSITQTLTPSTMLQTILLHYQEPSTQESTSSMSGNQKNGKIISALFAAKSFIVERLKMTFLGFAQRSVAATIGALTAIAKDAVRSFLTEKTVSSVSVVKLVRTEAQETESVYNLSVDGNHTYFANGILTHNCDEEMPLELLGELQSRLNATDGYFHLSFTATIGQDFWRRTIEPRPTEKEEFPNALKLQVSLYDCLKYEDGSNSHWTEERIERIIARCPTQTDVLVRVHGKFASAGGRVYESYDPVNNRSPAHPLPKTWHVYSGIDIGSGSDDGVGRGHPSAICFVAVDQNFRKGRVFKFWRGDGIRTTSGDVLVKYLAMRADLAPVLQCYDYSSAEFKMLGEAAGETFERADKGQESSQRILNTLFKHQMLSLQEDPEIDKLDSELCTLLKTTPKQNALDDGIDSLRYAVSKIPWDFGAMEGMPVTSIKAKHELTDLDRRRGLEDSSDADKSRVDNEIDEWNTHYGS